MFGLIRQLPFCILIEIGFIDPVVSNHMEATNDIIAYRSTLPSPKLDPTGPISKP